MIGCVNCLSDRHYMKVCKSISSRITCNTSSHLTSSQSILSYIHSISFDNTSISVLLTQFSSYLTTFTFSGSIADPNLLQSSSINVFMRSNSCSKVMLIRARQRFHYNPRFQENVKFLVPRRHFLYITTVICRRFLYET